MDDLKAVDITQRIVLGLLVIPIVIVVLGALVQLFDGDPANPVVAGLTDAAATVTPASLTTMFADQTVAQTLMIALAFYGLLVAALAGVFKLLRVVAEVRTPTPHTPAPPPLGQTPDAPPGAGAVPPGTGSEGPTQQL